MEVNQYDQSTVVNRDQFNNLVEFRECPVEGRSLIVKSQLSPGDIVLVEKPRLQYLLRPTCRSSLSPTYSKKLWKTLSNIVDNDEFLPGLPAAMLAYLRLDPSDPSYDFFYYPDFEHATVHLVRRACEEVVATVREFATVNAGDMAEFVLKIYANAHTVSFSHDREKPTHTKKKARRQYYVEKWGESYSFKPDDLSRQRAMICLMSWGSKFAHSCAPNLFLQYEPKTNTMVFRAVRTLAPGTVLSFSYLPEDDMSLGGLICGTMTERRLKLDQFKFFHCTCVRCMKEEGVLAAAVDESVERTVLRLAAVAHGLQVDQEAVGMIEPYLEDLDVPAETHWVYGAAQSALAAYHLRVFPAMFGKGLAQQLGLIEKGLAEADAYIRYLNDRIWPDDPMAAFFAGWRVLELILDSSSSDLVARVSKDWMPLIRDVFSKRPSPVIDDMIKRIEKVTA
ncbi:hypothetical protein BX666DRAFT_1869033 [Dichotomocladium elegans]|nr:hypothetical protein BX666DRAFT_1869033 [Dichotomocladium elegans]